MAKFWSIDRDLYIDGQKVLRGWESYSGWYWFATKKVCEQDSIINDEVVKNDSIWYGLVQGHVEEWGDFSEGMLCSLGHKVWEIPKRNLPHSGRRV